ncbi:hypothetical protein FACS1894162_0370 [Bacteroidia bacterium]|nr:hypothetical protein FACS1894162_0370 [Bacteroidia bacterium]
MEDNIKSIWHEHKNLIIGIIILPMIGFFVSLLISAISDLFTWRVFLYFVAIVAIVIFSSLYVVYLMHSEEQKKKNKGCWCAIELLKEYKADLTHNSLISYQELERIEEGVQPKEEIFIFTSEFKLDQDKKFEKNVILKNFKEQVKYTYIIPDDPATISTFKELAQSWVNQDGNIKDQHLLKAYKIDSKWIYMTIAIYNAKKARDIIVKFPSGTFDKSKYPFIFRLSPDDDTNKKRFYNALSVYIKEENKITDLWEETK